MTGRLGGVSAADVIALLTSKGLTVAVAESLTGGMLTSELVSVPGASLVVRGGLVAYQTAIKQSVLGVPSHLLALNGPVHPDVALAMASGARTMFAVDGVPADVGIGTTGVAGPEPQDGHPPGVVFVGIATATDARVIQLTLDGDREHIRRAVVSESLSGLFSLLTSV